MRRAIKRGASVAGVAAGAAGVLAVPFMGPVTAQAASYPACTPLIVSSANWGPVTPGNPDQGHDHQDPDLPQIARAPYSNGGSATTMSASSGLYLPVSGGSVPTTRVVSLPWSPPPGAVSTYYLR